MAWPDLRDSDLRTPREDVYIATSTDGIIWTSDKQVNDPNAGPARAVFPQVHAAPGRAVVLWEDWRSGRPNIYFQTVATEE